MVPICTWSHRSQCFYQNLQQFLSISLACGVVVKVDKNLDSTAEGRQPAVVMRVGIAYDVVFFVVSGIVIVVGGYDEKGQILIESIII